MNRAWWCAVAILAFASVACGPTIDVGSNNPATDGGGDAGGDAGGGPRPPDSCPVSPGTGCNTLPWGGIVHAACIQGTAPPPKGTGGSIRDGNYVLSAYSVYGGGPNGTCLNTVDRRGAASFHAGTLDLARDLDPLCQDPVSVDSKTRQTWKVSASASTLAGPESCDTYPGSLSSGTSWSYTATPNTLVLAGQYAVSTYTLVP